MNCIRSRLCYSFRRIYLKSSSQGKQTVVEDGHPESSNFETVQTFLASHPQFSSSNQLSSLFDCFKSVGIDADKASPIIAACPELLNLSLQRVQKSLHSWISCQFGLDHVTELLSTHPQLLFLSSKDIHDRFSDICQHFNRKSQFKVILNSPHVMQDNWSIVMKKIKYLEEDLGYKQHEVSSSGALSHSYEKLKERFEFLIRAGVFKLTKPKAASHEPSTNPSINVILLTTDIIFSTKVAGLSLEEFEVFKEVIREELEDESDEEL